MPINYLYTLTWSHCTLTYQSSHSEHSIVSHQRRPVGKGDVMITENLAGDLQMSGFRAARGPNISHSEMIGQFLGRETSRQGCGIER